MTPTICVVLMSVPLHLFLFWLGERQDKSRTAGLIKDLNGLSMNNKRNLENEQLRRTFEKVIVADPEVVKYWPVSDLFLVLHPNKDSEDTDDVKTV